MFNFINNLFSNFWYTKPSVQYFQPKVLNVYFKNSLTPVFKQISLSNYNHSSLEVVSEKRAENNVFDLVLALSGNKEEIIILATFETRKEAEDALAHIKTKLFAPEKGLVKFTFILFVLMLLSILIANLFGNLMRNHVMAQQEAQYSQVPPFAAGAALNGNGVANNDEAQKKMYEALQKLQQQRLTEPNSVQGQNAPAAQPQAAAPQAPGSNVPTSIPVDPEVSDFNKKLGN